MMKTLTLTLLFIFSVIINIHVSAGSKTEQSFYTSEKQSDIDFNILEKDINPKPEINLEKDVLHIKQYVVKAGELTVTVFSEDGEFMKRYNLFDLKKGENNFTINTKGWKSGDYFVLIENGKKPLSETFRIP